MSNWDGREAAEAVSYNGIEQPGGEDGKRRQNPGYPLEELSNVLCVLWYGGTS